MSTEIQHADQHTEQSAPKPLIARVAEKYGVDANKLLPTLKATAFKQRGGDVSNEQMMALMIVSEQYNLNPFTKEIYAYPDQGGIVPVVGVDGWSRIMNQHPQMDGIEFEYSEETVQHKGKTCHVWIECSIYRKDREKPVRVREFFEEVVRTGNYKTPWDSHPNRMHRHKVQIQTARVAFGFAGIYDQDEAERIVDVSGHASHTVDREKSPEAASQLDALNAAIDNSEPIDVAVDSVIVESEPVIEPEPAPETEQGEVL